MREKVEAMVAKMLKVHEPLGLTVPERKEFGHYSTNVALRLAKKRKKNPLELGKELVSEIKAKAPRGFFERVEAVPPGFINFWLGEQVFEDELARIFKENKTYGTSNEAKKKKIQIEFISANPTGPLTLANGRGGFYGDVLSNVLATQGWRVEREYYVNDAGNQVRLLGESLLAARGLIVDEEKFYKGAYVKEWARAHAALVDRLKNKPEELGRRAAKDFLNDTKAVLQKKAGIHFDRFTSEYKTIRDKDYPHRALAVFKKRGVVYEHEGALWLKTTAFGDDKDRVLVKRDGTPTYILVDAGHYLETKERGFYSKILVLGPDHFGYVARLQAVASLVGLKDSRVRITQAVRLVRRGEEVKMSKRRGEFVTFEEVIDEVGKDAARFLFLVTSLNSHLDFDLELAKEHSMKNPVYYVQYAYVRASHIILNAKKVALRIPKKIDLEKLRTEEDKKLIFEVVYYPSLLKSVARNHDVHALTRYATELARAFHAFYEKEQVVGEERTLAEARLALVEAARSIFENLFGVLGIEAPKKM